ncbi:hypothetical protein THIARS_50326 [Thiomonas delicata]|uniref:Uncharacterized protein n=1 Tax=Thiomonas delicata TaxID=364030 RepID=A0A238D1D3_THIDL|nr:hypothetical protein THIARS_50326 [Thiomonas delicata]
MTKGRDTQGLIFALTQNQPLRAMPD